MTQKLQNSGFCKSCYFNFLYFTVIIWLTEYRDFFCNLEILSVISYDRKKWRFLQHKKNTVKKTITFNILRKHLTFLSCGILSQLETMIETDNLSIVHTPIAQNIPIVQNIPVDVSRRSVSVPIVPVNFLRTACCFHKYYIQAFRVSPTWLVLYVFLYLIYTMH